MNKQELCVELATRGLMTQKESNIAITKMVEIIMEEVAKGGEVSLVGFGTFKATERKGRTGRNPKTGESMEIPTRLMPTFKAGKPFKDLVSPPPKK